MDYERHVFDQPLYGTVNIYRVGDTLLDTGHVRNRAAVADALDGGALAGVDRVVLTHPHVDHVGGSQTVPELADLPHTVFEGVPAILRDYADYLRAARDEMRTRTAGLDTDSTAVFDSYFPLDDYAEDAIDIDRVVGDGDTVRLGGYDCEVVHVPGHSAQQMGLYHDDSDTLFSADLVSTNGYFMYGPLHCDIGAYGDSLRRVRDRDPAVLVPGHGEVWDDAERRIADAIEKADRTVAAVRAVVTESDGAATAGTIAREVFGATDATLHFLTQVACEYLDHLADEGGVRVDYRDDGVFAREA